MRKNFVTSCLSVLMLSQSGFANPLPIPDPLKFIGVKDSQEYKLGSSCVFMPFHDKSFMVDTTFKEQVVCDKNGSNIVPSFDTRNIEQYIDISIRKTETNTNTDANRDESLNVSIPTAQGIADAAATSNIRYKIESTNRTSIIDLSYIMTPYQRYLDGDKCKFKNFDDIQEQDLKFSFIQNGFFSKKEKIYEPCLAQRDATTILNTAGCNLISKHYFGISYTASVAIEFKTYEARMNFESKLSGKLKNLDISGSAVLEEELSHLLSDQIYTISTRFKSIGLNNFNEILKEKSNENKIALESIQRRQKDLVLHANQKDLDQIIIDMADLMTDLNTINNGIMALLPRATQQPYSLTNVLKSFYQGTSSNTYMTEEQVKVLDMFPIIAVGTSTHSEVMSIDGRLLATLNRAVTFAFNKKYTRQTLAEKKCKVKKL